MIERAECDEEARSKETLNRKTASKGGRGSLRTERPHWRTSSSRSPIETRNSAPSRR